ncbi:hypothetical protein [Neobacillus rhizophilus]|uniref:HNH endonuclease n=1 Tax=Neobacillus rhizophilus TaxID=2833579 RepID=A0A942U888_9BACI|nr:hypothetical protein [Neobacillus rhizophilus]MBS4212694.1 hypothetical protein [Neobacillus rhizophilus]
MIKIQLDKRVETEIRNLHIEFFDKKSLPKLKKFISQKNVGDERGKEEQRFLRFLLKIRHRILIGSPSQLQKVIIHISKNYSKRLKDDIKKTKTKKHAASILNSQLKAVFNYSLFCSTEDIGEWCAYQLLSKMHMQVCPYCNRQYITTIYTENQKTRAQLDHFFNKSTFPYLAISLYNLVPCCSVCNSSLKGKKEFYVSKNIHPYVEGFGENYRFTFDLADNLESLISKKGKINISFTTNSSDKNFLKRAKNNAEIFLLEKLYNSHDNIVKETIQKHLWYSDDYAESLLKSYPGVFSGKDEVFRMIFSSEVEESKFNLRPFSKLITDIAKELKIRDWI